MQRIIGFIASALIPLITMPVAAAAGEHAHAHADHGAVHERAAPKHSAVREHYAPRQVERHFEHPVVRGQYAPRPAFRHEAPSRTFEHRSFAQPRRYVEPRRIAPQRVAPVRVEHRNRFTQYYSRSYFSNVPERRRIVFHRYVPRRVFFAPQPQVVRTYVTRPAYFAPVYASYSAPVYYNTPVEVPLPIAWSPAVTYGPQYTAYPQYASYPQNSYGYGYGYNGYNGYNAPYGMSALGNAQVQGVVIASNPSGVLVLTPDLKPVFVNMSIAQQNGYVNGNIEPGTFVNVFGYQTGNEFIATALG